MNPTSNIIPESEYLQADQNQAAQQAQAQQAAKAPAPAQHTSFLDKILPMAGGTAGMIIGGLLAPETGGLSLLIPAAAAAAGGAAGQMGENAATGKKVLQGNDLASAAENGIGSLAGGALGKGISAIAGKGASLAATGASKLFSAQGPGIGEDLADFATQHLGINDLPTAAKFGEVMSGSTDAATNTDKGLVSKYVADAADKDPTKVDMSNLQPAMAGTSKQALQSQSLAATRNLGSSDNPLITEKLISDNGLTQQDADAVRRQVQGVLGRPDNAGSVSKSDLLGMQKQMAGMASDATTVAQRSGASADVAKAKVLNGINQQLKSSLGFDQTKVSPEDAKALADDITTNATPISKSAAQAVAKDITDAANSDEGLTVGQVRNMESNFVRLQGAAKDAMAAKDKNFGTSTADLLPTTGAIIGGGGPKSALGAIAGKITSSSKADSAVSTAASRLSDVLGKTSTSKIIPAMTRAGVMASANLPNVATNSQPASTTLNGITGGSMQPGGTQSLQASVNSSPLMQAYNTALTGGMGVGQNYTSAMTTLAPEAQKLQQAIPILQQLLGSYQNAGGAQGLLGGGLTQLTSLLPGTAANQYAKEQASAQSILAQLLGGNAASYAGAMPQLTSSANTAGGPTATINSLLGSI